METVEQNKPTNPTQDDFHTTAKPVAIPEEPANYVTFKRFLAHLASICVAVGIGHWWATAKDQKVWWLGSQASSTWSHNPSQFLPTAKSGYDIQLGVREDGTMVWRSRP